MSELIIISITLAGVAVLLTIIYFTYKLGKKHGHLQGEDAAAIRLLRFKDMQVWEVAHNLDADLQFDRREKSSVSAIEKKH
jgi:hypothetical protein